MFNNQIIAGSSGQGGSFYSYTIDQSLRVDDTASQRMYHNTVAGDAQKFTMSCWIKRTELTDSGTIMSSWNGASNFVNMYFSGDYLYCYICDNRSGFVDYNFNTASSTDGAIIFRDVGAWMHVVYAVDSTQSTATDRFTIWVNGVNTNARSGGSGNDIPLNYNMEINESPGQNFLFHNPDSASYYGSFYIAEMVYVDGTKYDADKFGEFNNGIWTPLDISTQSITYGNNGFYLDFADSSDLGKDVSGEGNHFTPGTRSAVVQNFSAHDQVLDSPTNNFATLNPLFPGNSGVYLEGNLKFQGGGFSSTLWGTKSTFAIPKDKKVYIELEETVGSGANWAAGIGTDSSTPSGTNVGGTGSITFYNRSVYVNGTQTDYGASAGIGGTGGSVTAGDIMGIAVDGSTGEVWFSRNGTYFKTPTTDDSGTVGDPSAGTNPIGTITNTNDEDLFLVIAAGTSSDNLFVNFGQDSVNVASAESDANGLGTFEYAPPTDHVCLAASSLSEPTIGPNSDTTSDEHFNTVLYTGTGATQSITGVGFQPDWTWAKRRAGIQEPSVTDSVRGVNAQLRPASLPQSQRKQML